MLGFVKTQRKGFFGIRLHYRTVENLRLIYQIPLLIIFYPLINEKAGYLCYAIFIIGLCILLGMSLYCISASLGLDNSQFCNSYADWWGI